MTRGFFITGTDTGVGKTVIAAALILVIKHMGFRVCGMKPIETGCLKSKFKIQNSKFKIKEKVLIPADGMFLKETADVDDSIDVITPIRFEKPLAPFSASEIEGIPVDIEKIKKAFESLLKKYDMVVVEGIGGLLVPINRNYFVYDLIKQFALPIIIVSRPNLGTINHTLLTVNYAIKEGFNVAGIIINFSQSPEKTLAEETNPKIIRQISPVPLIGIFPYLEDLEKSTMKQAAVKTLNLEIIRNYLQA
jgi:dethiobiotin synthetase